MPTVSELMAQNISNAQTNVETWGGVVINVKSYGAKGDGVTDDTAAFIKAFAAANVLMYTGLVATILHPGATVLIPDAVYNLSSLVSPIEVNCNVQSFSAEVNIPVAYAGIVFRVGLNVSGSALTGALVDLPQIRKTTNAPIVAGSIAIQTINLSTSNVRTKGIQYFETALYCTGLAQGTVYCEIHLGQILQCKRALVLIPGASGWVNSNQFYGGSISQSQGFAGGSRVSGWRHILMDGRAPGTAVVGNVFFGLSLEGDASEYMVDAFNAYENSLIGTYHETGYSSKAVSVSGDTITRLAHDLVVGDVVVFGATITPTGMFLAAPYYVTSVPTVDTFKVSQNKGGSAITFSSTGTTVSYIRSARCRFDSTGGLCYGNRFTNTLTVPSEYIDVIELNQASGNTANTYSKLTMSAFLDDDTPINRLRNSSSGATNKPLLALYDFDINPDTQPHLFSYAFSPTKGIVGRNKSSGVNTGVLGIDPVTLLMKYTNSSGSGEVPTGTRNSGSVYAISALSLSANAMTSTDITLSGVVTSEHVLVTILGALPTGVIYSHAYVVSTNTIRIYFYNNTASPISLTVNAQAMAFKRFV